MRKKKGIAVLLAVVFTIASLAFLQQLLMPKYMTELYEGALIEEYYRDKNTHDVVMVGDCEVYENLSPVTLWREYGITSFIRGSAQQLIWQSYYLMEETLKYEKPKVMVFNVLSMKYDKPQNEAYNRMSLDGMRLSSSKIKAVKASMTEEETLGSYIFPLLRYHSRWSELSWEDFKYLFHKDQKSHNGYLMRADIKPLGSLPTPKKLADYQFSDICYDYLDKMVKLCKDNGVELVLMKAPTYYPHWYDEWDQQMVEYAEENDLLYLNFLDLVEEIGLDFSVDTYDAGLHLNVTGAEKLSVYFGRILKEEFDLPDRRNDEKEKKTWAEKEKFYDDMKADQYREIEEYGYPKSYIGKPEE